MGWIIDELADWFKETLISGIMGNLEGLFDTVNEQVSEIALQVGRTPGEFSPGVFSMIQTLSETVVLPIAGLVLTFVATWELIQLIIEKNNLHDLDTWIFFRWILKTSAAILILSNTWNIVMAVFDIAQNVVGSAAGIISTGTDITDDMITTLEADLQLMEVGELLVIWMQSALIRLIIQALNIAVFIVVWGRMIEVYLRTSLAPIPLATLSNREYGQMGQNYLKSLCAIGFQGFLIMVCIAIYAILIQSIATSGDPMSAIWSAIGYTVLLCFTLFKSGSLAHSIFSAH